MEYLAVCSRMFNRWSWSPREETSPVTPASWPCVNIPIMAITLPTWGHRIELRENPLRGLWRAWEGQFQPATGGQAACFRYGPNLCSCVVFLQPGTAGGGGRRFGMEVGTIKCSQEDPGGGGWKKHSSKWNLLVLLPPSALEVLHSENLFVFHKALRLALSSSSAATRGLAARPHTPPPHTQPQLLTQARLPSLDVAYGHLLRSRWPDRGTLWFLVLSLGQEPPGPPEGWVAE